MIDTLITILSIFLGLQLTFWGLNGFFNWLPPPPSGNIIERFISSCYEVRFIMPTIKAIEVLAGIGLLFFETRIVSLLLLTPIIFGISGLQWLHHPKPGFITTFLLIPFWALVVLQITLLF